MYSRKIKKLNKQATNEWTEGRVEVKTGSVWGPNADYLSPLVGFDTDWDENTLEVFEHKPDMTRLRILNRSLWFLCWFKKKKKKDSGQGRPLGKATTIIQTRDQVSLDQGGRAESKVVRFWIYSEGSGNKIFWCFQGGLWKTDKHQFWAPWPRRINLLWTKQAIKQTSPVKGKTEFWF